ncbi:MAG: hypothetical protein IPP96_10985 [Chitinophagaceae bacterium]|nr:hypothetical protein [Chitinophagaceae bacterium]
MKKSKKPNWKYFNKAPEIISPVRRFFIMKKILTVLFILISSVSFTQNLARPTQFDKFISKSYVEWAAYVNDQVRFEKEHLNKVLLERLIKKEINAALPVYNGINDANPIIYLNKDSAGDILIDPACRLPIPEYDSSGNPIIPDLRNEIIRNRINPDSLLLTDITQILFIEDGVFKSYVPLISPMNSIKTSMGIYLGQGSFLSTCFNFKYNYRPRKKSNSLFLAETTRKINLDSAGVISTIKQLYNRNLIETLWPYILLGKADAFSIETNTKLKKEEINQYLLRKTRIPVPTYDSTGTVSGFILPQLDFSPEEFTEIELIQDWYYNYRDNIVFNKIKELLLYVKSPSVNEESIPILKIVFN